MSLSQSASQAQTGQLAVVGAGMLGLAHAYAAARRGYQVTVFERDSRAIGASVRNFGLGLLLGQAQGECYELAASTLASWRELLPRLGIWHKQAGSLMLARNRHEAALLSCFQELLGSAYQTRLLSQTELAQQQFQAESGLYSPHEIGFASAELIPRFSQYLQQEFGVSIHYGCAVHGVEQHRLHTAQGCFDAEQILICSGHEFRHLLPELYQHTGLQLCSLQMQKVKVQPRQIAPSLLTGLSCLHYASFQQHAELRELGAAYQAELQNQCPRLLEHGIHLIVQQLNEPGYLLIGDTHRYGDHAEIWQDAASDALLRQLTADLLGCEVQAYQHWQGVYASGKQPYYVLDAMPGVRAIHMGAGIGMSLGLALAAKVVESLT